MNDQTPTDEQRAAWLRLSNSPDAPDHIGGSVEEDAALIAPLLPDSLTNPQPALPTEPDYYKSVSLHTIWMLRHTGKWHRFGDGEAAPMEAVLDSAPFVRMVEDRPKVTAEQVRHIVGTGTLLPSEINQLVALANGEDLS